jgi:hypothetical protein
MLRRWVLRSVVVLALSLPLIGCSMLAALVGAVPQVTEPQQTLANGTVVDNIRVGNAADCATDPDCATRIELAKDAVIERHGVPPSAIGAVQFYRPYLPPGAARGTGGFKIVVFDLEDGSQAAVNTFCMDSCSVVPRQPVQPLTLEGSGDHGPLVDPKVEAPLTCSSADHPACDEAVQVAIDRARAIDFVTSETIAKAHYYVIYVAPGTPEAAISKAEYIVDIYIAGEHDVLAETAIGVYCGSGPCQVVPS